MKRIYIAFFALLALTLCACSTTSSESAPVAASPASSPTATMTAMSTAEMEKTLIELEKKTWNVYQDKNVDAYRKYFTADYRTIYFGGIKNVDENFSDVKDITIKSISFSDWKVSFPVKDAAIVTYKYTASSSYKGKDTSGNSLAITVWTNINGEWKAAGYAEAKAEPPPKK